MHRLLLRALVALALFFGALVANAGTDIFEYDPLGRLKKWTDSQGRVTDYIYDAVGNIKEVKPGAGSTVPAPTISGVTPTSIRQGAASTVTVAGANLAGATITTSVAGLTVSSVTATSAQVTFNLAVAQTAALGSQNFMLTTATGNRVFTVTVAPPVPTLLVSPSPIAIPVDPVEKRVFVRLSNADTVDRVLSLSSGDVVVATINPASTTIPAGQTEVEVRIRGLATGITQLSVSSAGLQTVLVPLYVTSEFGGINVASAPLLGVNLLGDAGSGSSFTGDAQAANLGVAFGRYVTGVSPARISINDGTVSLAVTGEGLASVTGVEIVPPDGLTVSAVQAQPDGRSVTATLIVDPAAPTLQRRVRLLGPDNYPPVRPEADRILVTLALPEITAIEPISAVPGTSGIAFYVYGRNLTGATSVAFDPPTGIVVGSSPVVDSGGTRLSVGVSLALNAPVGNRIVTVQSPAGISDATPSVANTFRVATEVINSVPALTAPLVGIVLGAALTPPTSQSLDAQSQPVGVAFGATAITLTPPARQAGDTFSLQVNGVGLQGVTALEFSPAQGITAGSVSVSPDGTTITVPVTLAADAERTVRIVIVRAGTQRIAFTTVTASQFYVTGPTPQITSVAPLLIQVGSQPSLTVSGVNFQDVTGLQLEPATGITYGPIMVNANGTGVTVPLLVAANAPAGQRVVRLSTPAMTTTATAELGNTVTLYSGTATSIDPVLAPALGVVLQSAGGGGTTTLVEPIVSPLLGLVLQGASPPAGSINYDAFTGNLGIALGPVATSITQSALNQSGAGSITISGFALNSVTAVSLVPSAGLTLGTFTVTPDGASLTLPVTVEASAAIGPRQLVLAAGATSVLFVPGAPSVAYVTVQAPAITSMEPIVVSRGTAVELLIRGTNLHFSTGVTLSPANGVAVVSPPSVNAAGTELRISLSVPANAATGARLIQVITPGGSSTATLSPANTLNIN